MKKELTDNELDEITGGKNLLNTGKSLQEIEKKYGPDLLKTISDGFNKLYGTIRSWFEPKS